MNATQPIAYGPLLLLGLMCLAPCAGFIVVTGQAEVLGLVARWFWYRPVKSTAAGALGVSWWLLGPIPWSRNCGASIAANGSTR